MEAALLIARLLLAAVFIVASLSKLADLAGSRKAMEDFGLPAPLAGPFGLLLPLAELIVALALIPQTTAYWGAVGALGLTLAFIAGVSVTLLRGRRPNCHCFGQIHSEPIGASTILRNVGLALVAGFIVWRGATARQVGPSLTDLGAGGDRLMLVISLIGLVMLAGMALLLVQMLIQHGRVLLRLDSVEESLSELRAAVAAVPSAPAWEAPAPAYAPQAQAQAAPTAYPSQVPPAPAAQQPHQHDHGHAHAQPAAPAQHVGLPLGSPAPSFHLSGVQGEMVRLEALLAYELPLLLVFADPNCGPCNALMPDIGRWQQENPDITIAVISRGNVEANRAKATQHGMENVLLQKDYEVANAYQAHGTPGAVLVRADGTIGSSVALGADEIRALAARTFAGLRGAQAAPAPAPAAVPTPAPVPAAEPNGHGANGHEHAPAPQARPVTVGSGFPAPEVRLPDLDGRIVDLANFRGDRTLVVFWNPGCGFCSQMLPDLKLWEESPPPGAPRLLVISTGSVEENRAMGLRAPVLLDQGFTVGRAFGANGTPMGVIIDENGNIASGVAAGAQQVFELAGASPATA